MRMDNDAPRIMPTTDKVDPKRQLLRLIEEPIETKSKTDNEVPKHPLMTDSAAPNFKQALSDNEAPKLEINISDNDDPSWATPLTETDAPNLVTLLSERESPRLANISTATDAPR